MENDTDIIVLGNGETLRMSWGGFAANNDADIVADAAAQIEAHGYAYVGGGASPGVYVAPIPVEG